ncbi:MAG TPA: hypothetical protein VFC19_22060, partial [Candidatus Limnocylindrales bacterium]|nr:hypothetical protein [Candidatus Limnocylindrales bacterium]
MTAGTDVTSYLYDADGDLLISREPGVSTLRLGSTEVFASASSVAAVRYYDKVAVRTAVGVLWTVADRNGTPVVQTDAASWSRTGVGRCRSASPAATSPTGRAVRASLVARRTAAGSPTSAPAPTSSRWQFTSVDPDLDTADPDSWHGYAYVGHSPLTFADPRGAVASASTSAAALPT